MHKLVELTNPENQIECSLHSVIYDVYKYDNMLMSFKQNDNGIIIRFLDTEIEVDTVEDKAYKWFKNLYKLLKDANDDENPIELFLQEVEPNVYDIKDKASNTRLTISGIDINSDTLEVKKVLDKDVRLLMLFGEDIDMEVKTSLYKLNNFIFHLVSNTLHY